MWKRTVIRPIYVQRLSYYGNAIIFHNIDSPHPCIQKESHYIKFLCCDDKHKLLLWVNAIRIAKYGKALYSNYSAAVKRSSPLRTFCSASRTDRPNGHAPQVGRAPPPTTAVEDYPDELPPDFIPPPPPPPGHI